ncbi:MoaB/Mog domain-containing protein [Lasiosphaeris hirsuta]|uniref:MoaB/Mog domain-containing protein n=1 Tax=Lasiosphaeris hirsuta TaxID=260670 RepID=A0AA40AFK2_9PEZI|nr:MoaB/Mog domain-containing protein [Lasiosphaeris hirsuta]
MTSAATADERGSRAIHTAACLVIGDEVLGGKAGLRDNTNSNFMAGWCFNQGISLKRIEVIQDDEPEIIEAVRRMSERYDFVVTSGGIGPTHDDITYKSIAKAFGLPLTLHQEAYALMRKLSKPHPGQPNFSWDEDSAALRAKLRMVELPTDSDRDLEKQVLFPCPDLWVPVSVVNGNVHILPGVPRLFTSLLDGLKPFIAPRLTDPDGKGTVRVIISTPLPESAVAEYLTGLADRVESKGVKVGSYPRWGKKRNTVTLVGKDRAFLDAIAPEVVHNVKGRIITVEGEDDDLPAAEL